MYRTDGNRTPLGITETPHPLDTPLLSLLPLKRATTLQLSEDLMGLVGKTVT